jgi:hypothetical protein
MCFTCRQLSSSLNLFLQLPACLLRARTAAQCGAVAPVSTGTHWEREYSCSIGGNVCRLIDIWAEWIMQRAPLLPDASRLAAVREKGETHSNECGFADDGAGVRVCDGFEARFRSHGSERLWDNGGFGGYQGPGPVGACSVT